MGNQSSSSVEEDIRIKCSLEEMIKQFFKEYAIFWHDPNVNSEENKQYIVQLQRFCEVKTFTEWERATIEVEEAQTYCHVITSGTNGEQLVEEISKCQNVVGIYIFCKNKSDHSDWAKEYKMISCVETRIQKVLNKIDKNLLKWYSEESSLKVNLPAFSAIFNGQHLSRMANLHRHLKVIPNFKDRLQAKKDFLSLSRAIYSKKEDKEMLALFEKDYKKYDKKETLNWYTQESFVYRITNKCLRIATSDSIQYCRLLLKDIEQAIQEQYREKSKRFSGLGFRCAYISQEEWSILKANIFGEIEMHGFMSVSKEKNVALNFLKDLEKMVLITILVPKGPNEEEQGFAEVEEFSKYPEEQEILFNVRSRFIVLETEEVYSQDMPFRHLVLLYGAQGFRKFVTEENPVHNIVISEIEHISCSICKEVPQNMFFAPLNIEEIQRYFCKKCLTSDILATQTTPFFCIPKTSEEKQVKLKGFLTKLPMKVPMYGYECKKCQAKKQDMYYQCPECNCERREVWCQNCIDCLSECIQRGHRIIVERSPFSFWYEKMSQKELDHLKFQNKILEGDDKFQQAEMHVESQEYKKAIEYYEIYIQKNGKKKEDEDLAIAYNNLANEYDRQAEHKKALEYYSQALKTDKAFDEKAYSNFAISLNNMGRVYQYQGEYQKALEHHYQALDIFENFSGENHPDTATSLSNIGNVYQDLGEHQKALDHHYQALEIFKKLYGETHPKFAACLLNVGNVYQDQGEFQTAIQCYFQALQSDNVLHGDDHPEVATSLCSIGNVYYLQEEYVEALKYYFQGLEKFKGFYRKDHPEVATSLDSIGNVYKAQEEYQKALDHHYQALEIFKKLYGETHPKFAACLLNVGNVYQDQGKFQEAQKYYSRARKIFLKCHGENHPNVLTCLINLGNISQNLVEHQKALEYFYQALNISLKLFRKNHPKVAASFESIGNVYLDQSEYQKALEYYSQALKIYKSLDDYPNVAVILGNMGNVYYHQGEYKKALEHYSQSLEIDKAIYGENTPDLADSLISLGQARFALKEYDEARKCYFKALEMMKSKFGEHDPGLATIYCHIGNAYNKLGEQEDALGYHLKSLNIRKQVFHDNHPHLAKSYSGIGRVHFSLGEYDEALKYHFKVLDITKSVCSDELDRAEAYYDVANVFKSRGERREALKNLLESWKIRKQASGETHPETVAVSAEILALSKELKNEQQSMN